MITSLYQTQLSKGSFSLFTNGRSSITYSRRSIPSFPVLHDTQCFTSSWMAHRNINYTVPFYRASVDSMMSDRLWTTIDQVHNYQWFMRLTLFKSSRLLLIKIGINHTVRFVNNCFDSSNDTFSLRAWIASVLFFCLSSWIRQISFLMNFRKEGKLGHFVYSVLNKIYV